METIIIILTLFVVGALLGWVIEVLFRRIFTRHKWINPGFLVGPYLPLYGFGTILLYGMSNIELQFTTSIDIIIRILAIGILMTLIEYIAGLIFIKGMNIKLWDYSNRWGNIKGIICPLFSFLWLIVGTLYYYFINPFLVNLISWLSDNIIYCFFVGLVIGAMIVDLCYSLHLGIKISNMAKRNKMIIYFEDFKTTIKEKFKEEHDGLKRSLGTILSNLELKSNLKEYLKKYQSLLNKKNKK